MKEARIEKVENGYIIRCFSDSGFTSTNETYVYNSFQDVIELVSSEMNEPLRALGNVPDDLMDSK